MSQNGHQEYNKLRFSLENSNIHHFHKAFFLNSDILLKSLYTVFRAVLLMYEFMRND